jgi:hypothetical protein
MNFHHVRKHQAAKAGTAPRVAILTPWRLAIPRRPPSRGALQTGRSSDVQWGQRVALRAMLDRQ